VQGQVLTILRVYFLVVKPERAVRVECEVGFGRRFCMGTEKEGEKREEGEAGGGRWSAPAFFMRARRSS
jgi:hypothetical protein